VFRQLIDGCIAKTTNSTIVYFVFSYKCLGMKLWITLKLHTYILPREARIESTDDERTLDGWFWKSTSSLNRLFIPVCVYNPNTNLLNNFCYSVLRISSWMWLMYSFYRSHPISWCVTPKSSAMTIRKSSLMLKKCYYWLLVITERRKINPLANEI
jgi:hypothetical protein